jgi:long-subunit acyl-CoA synthetase (AMP-forming)
MKSLTNQKYNNIAEMLINSKNKFYKKPAIRWIQKTDNRIQTISYSELVDSMTALFYGLKELGFKKEDHIGIFSDSTPEWIISDFGIQALGAVCVPIDPTLKLGDTVSILEDSKCKVLFVDTYKKAKEINSYRENVPELKLIVVCSPKKTLTQQQSVISFEKLLKIGEQQYHSSNRFNRSVSSIIEEDGAYIHYNLNSSDELEGKMVTHKDVLSDARQAVEIIKEQGDQLRLWQHHYLSILSLSDPFSRVFIVASLLIGTSIDIILKNLEMSLKSLNQH